MLATIPFYALLGNHDVPADAQVEIRYSQGHANSGRWQMPGYYSSRDFGIANGHPCCASCSLIPINWSQGISISKFVSLKTLFSSDPGRQRLSIAVAQQWRQ